MDNEMKVIYYRTLPVPDKNSKLLQYGFELIEEGNLLYLVLVNKCINGITRYYIDGYASGECSMLRAKEHIKHACDYLSDEYKVVGIRDIKTLLVRKGMSINNEAFFEPFYIE